jgi:hypothetical protein
MRVFFPVEDRGIDADAGVLVPYRCGLACAHELRDALVLENGVWRERTALNDGCRSDRPASNPASPPVHR